MYAITPFRNARGNAGLIGLMMASAIGTIVMLSNVDMVDKMARQHKDVAQTSSALDLKRDIETLLTDPRACEANFQNNPVLGEDQTINLTDAAGAVKYEINQAYDNNQLRFIKLRVENSDTIIQSIPPARQIVNLHMFLEKVGQPGKTIVRTVKLFTQRVGAVGSAIDTCYALVGTGSDIWLRQSGTDNIFNSNRDNVGVGTPTPTEKLHVNGNMQTSGQSTVNSLAASGDIRGAGNMTAMTSIGFGATNPLYAMNVAGNMSTVGDSTVTGNYTSRLASISNNVGVGGNLTVTGNGNLNNWTSIGPARFQGVSTVAGSAQIASSANMRTTLSVNGGVANPLGVVGNMSSANTTSNSTQANSYCIGGFCRTTFQPQTCPSGYVARSIASSGVVSCVDVRCPANHFFHSLNPGVGSPNCAPLPFPGCPLGSYVTNYDAVTGFSCALLQPGVMVSRCPLGTFLLGVNGATPRCTQLTVPSSTCPSGQSVIRMNPDGSVTCGASFAAANTCADPLVMTGINADGSARCGNLVTPLGACPAGQVVSRILADGTRQCSGMLVGGSCPNGVRDIIPETGEVICANAPTITLTTSTTTTTTIISSCAATTRTWGAGCSRALATESHGYNSGVVPNQAAGYSGSAIFTCNNAVWTNSSETCTALTAVTCGGAHTNSYNDLTAVNAAGLCNDGTAGAVTVDGGTGRWVWNCSGTGGPVACYAVPILPPTDITCAQLSAFSANPNFGPPPVAAGARTATFTATSTGNVQLDVVSSHVIQDMATCLPITVTVTQGATTVATGTYPDPSWPDYATSCTPPATGYTDKASKLLVPVVSGNTYTVSYGFDTVPPTYIDMGMFGSIELPTGAWSWASCQAVPTIPIGDPPFEWVPAGSCSAGFTYLQIDNDTKQPYEGHKTWEEGFGGPNRWLCSNLATGSQWLPVGTPCDPGFVDTELLDDNDGKHNLSEDDGDSGGTDVMHMCWSGISGVTWASSCPAGTAWTGIKDDTDSRRSLGEEGKSGAVVYMCVSP